MDKKQKLNNLAVLAKGGDKDAMWKIKHSFYDFIFTLSESNRHSIPNQADFEDECYRLIEETVNLYDTERGNLSALIVRNVKKRLARVKERHRHALSSVQIVPFPVIIDADVDEKYQRTNDIEDGLAAIDGEFMAKEMITRLASGDRRREIILTSWTEPRYNNLETAKLLAQLYGNGVETHRKFIQRFKKECKIALGHAV